MTQVIETLNEGLKRSFSITVPSAHILGLRDMRLAEIAGTVAITGYRRGEAPWPMVMQRFGAAVLGEVLEQEVAAAVQRLLTDRAMRPETMTTPTVDVARFVEGSDLAIAVAFELMPDVPIPDLTGVRVERLCARPGEPQLRAALARLADRHGTLEALAPRPAERGDLVVCDLEGGVLVDLLGNGPGLGARAGNPGLAPADWSIDVTPELGYEIAAVGIEDGLPCFDVTIRGTTRPGAFIRIFPTMPRGLVAAPAQLLTLCMRARVIAGALPDGARSRIGFNVRSKSDFLGSLRHPARLGEGDMRATLTMLDDAAVAYARPVLDVEFGAGVDLDVTLRIGAARVFAGAEEPEALLFKSGFATDETIEVGGPGAFAGLGAQLEGLAPGQTRVVDTILPPDPQAPELANRRARYAVTAKVLKRRQPRLLDDALAREVGQADLAALTAAIMRTLQRDYDARTRLHLKTALLQAVVAKADFPVPDGLLEGETAQIRMRMQDKPRADRPDATMADANDTEPDGDYRALAARRIRLRLVLAEIAHRHDLTVSDQEIAHAIRREAERYPGQQRQVLDFYRGNAAAQDALRAPLLEDKVVDLLLGQVEVEEREVMPQELGAES